LRRRGWLVLFWDRIHLPYLVGSILPGLAVSALLAWVTVPLVAAYKAMRVRRIGKRRTKGDDGAAPSP
jgi:hypothetical protein